VVIYSRCLLLGEKLAGRRSTFEGIGLMTRSHAQRSFWPLTMLATLGAALAVQACSGRVQQPSDCLSGSSCGGGVGTAGGGAVAGGAGDSGAGTGTIGTCRNNQKDPDESDVDCGGTSHCARCPTASSCTKNADCETAFCADRRCVEPTCSDGIENQDETDVDCGGSCRPCDGGGCSSNDDCSSQYCKDQSCADHCQSGKREADETDTDCGGFECEPCADKERCREASDCQSLVCSKGLCSPATCNDQIKNQDESDLDCGGVCSERSPCPVAARCNTPADCESWICSAAHKCSADIVIPPLDVIDDFEDGDFQLPANPTRGGRAGSWYLFSDGTGIGTYDVFAIKRGSKSVEGLRVQGSGFSGWGSGIGVDLNRSGASDSSKLAYDAAAYSGITFWARAASSSAVKVALPDVDTDSAGMTCSSCGRHYSKFVQIGTDWQRFTVAFSDLAVEPGGVPTPTGFKPSGVVSVQFWFASGQNYDLYIDDVALVK